MNINRHIFSIVLLTLFFAGCKKDHNVLGVDVQPASDVLGATFCDTSLIQAYSFGYDSTASFNDRYKFLGSNQDPIFGRTDVGLYVNANMPNNITNVNFGDDANIVSSEIILTVATLDFVGNYTTALTYSVFPVKTLLDKNLVYYSNNKDKHNKTASLSNYTGTLSVMDTKLVLRIPVDVNYAKAILNNPQYLTDNATFQNTYKGFYITSEGSALNPANAQGSITKFDLDDPLSGFYLYYQNGTPSATKENKKFAFAFTGTDAARYNTISYQPGSGGNMLLTQQLLDKDTIVAGRKNLFLKGLGGSRLKLMIPGIKNYSDSFPISINRAEIVFYPDPSFTSTGGIYAAPPRLALLPISADSREMFTEDQLNQTDLQRYDGNYDEDNNKYVFNIARHVQAISRGTKTNKGFYVVVADPDPIYTARRDNYAERVVLAGTAHATLKPKFNLSYIKLKHDK